MAAAKASLTHPTEAGLAAVTPYTESRDATGTTTKTGEVVRMGEAPAKRFGSSS